MADEFVEKILLDEKTIKKRVEEIAGEISVDYDSEALLFIGVLKGSVMFMADLMRSMKSDVSMDFMAVSSYGASSKSSGVVRILKDLDTDIEGKNVLIVEDIIDTGTTLKYLYEYLMGKRPKSLKIACLLDRPYRRKVDIKADYIGFTIPDEFVVGYGLDYAEKFRQLPYIGILKEEVYKK
ncbi:MAG TPA: hypoxanthine phosphoribosyltransferase [Clostridiaceae bacterium]|jgi:hypoxanthine phosphoribosyltransferase|nr:hypoxanthine phosphoribosyltransferase [Clostridiaceae bacterium]HBF76803.1 hypoxanthine phosphoribosyltransferase [Clostridiaceae bacterium]HBG38443.1 hypoxanthine phosphoribosyltransferase [Clostridiaceae bacterium]HBN28864.1 hypoxanthine phosphoribosyltransferase [Clostridiaceae bacterium]HBX47520.1 hypoxanthine phosphoribosyltransferase [Clostridiaceae bacterium]